MTNVRLGLVLLGAVGVLTLARAHEGHEAIKAKGITQDEEGNILVEAAARRAIGLATAEVDMATVEQTLRLNSRVIVPWDRQGFASTRLEGVVRHITVRPGQRVKAGEPLATIESLPLQALRQEAEQAQLELALAEQNLARARELGETIIAGREIMVLEARRDDRRNAVANLRQKLEAIGSAATGSLVPVRAPIAGTVVEIDVVLGQHVEPNAHLFEIHDLSRVWVEMEVPETHVDYVHVGQEARLSFAAVADRVFEGTVDFAASTLDPDLHLRRVFVALDNPGEALLPGMFGTGAIVLERTDDAFVVTAEGVVTVGAERYAFVQIEEGKYSPKKVVLGSRSPAGLEVKDGLYPGDVVVTQGNHELSALFAQGTLKLSDEAKETIGFAAEEVDYRTVDRVVVADARIVVPVARRALATTRMEGKVEAIHVTLGQQVEAGHVLADVHSLELQNIQLDLVLAHLKRDVAKRQVALLRALAGVAPRKELARLENELGRRNSEISALRRRLLVMGLDDAEIERVRDRGTIHTTVSIRAPFGGRVAEILVVLGQVVHAGDPLLELLDTSQLWAEGAFFEADVGALLAGGLAEKPAIVQTTAHDEPLEARLSFFNPVLLGGARSLAAYVELENADGALLPGMRATLTVSVERPTEAVIAVPLRALLAVGSKRYVFVQENDDFQRVEVLLGRRDARHIEVLQGLFPGDQVVVSGVNELNNALAAVR